MNNDKILVEHLINAIGDNTNRPGLIDTPQRVVKMWKEIFKGYNPANRPVITTFKNGRDGIAYDQMIIDTGDFYSHCEHHMVPFFGNYWFGYIPAKNGYIVGLSKVARVVDYFSSKLQVQERLVQEITDYLWEQLSDNPEKVAPIGMGIMMEGEHLCKTMRGVKKKGIMTTTCFKGAFLDNPAVRNEFLQRCTKR